NMPAIMKLCGRAILLASGRIAGIGDTQPVVYRYLKGRISLAGERHFEARHPTTAEVTFTCVRVLDNERKVSAYVDVTKGLYLEITYKVHERVHSAQVGFLLWNSQGICVLTSTNWDNNTSLYDRDLGTGEYCANCYIPGNCLRPGQYSVDIASSVPGYKMLDEIRDSIAFEAIDHGSIETKLSQGRLGVIAPVLDWVTTKTVE
ncbi:MAG: hypothetical protein CVT63_07280, partial [Candidatus Anoxymicrobium japonicum]